MLCAIVVIGAIFGLFGRFNNSDALTPVDRVKTAERAANRRDARARQKAADAEAKRELRERWEAEQAANPGEGRDEK